MAHSLLQPIQQYIRSTSPFRDEDFTHVKGLLETASSNINRGILDGSIDGFEVAAIERQLSELRREASQKRHSNQGFHATLRAACRPTVQTGAEYIQRIRAERHARLNSPPAVSKFPPGHKAKVIPFRMGMGALQRHLPDAS